MNRLLFSVFLLFSMLHTPAMSEEQMLSAGLLEEIEKAMRPYFNALKSGNTQRIIHYTSGKKQQQFQRRLKRDKEYSKFLREFYKDAVFSVMDGVTTDEGVIVTVHVAMPEETLGYRYRLQRQNNGVQQGGWLIIEEPNVTSE